MNEGITSLIANIAILESCSPSLRLSHHLRDTDLRAGVAGSLIRSDSLTKQIAILCRRCAVPTMDFRLNQS